MKKYWMILPVVLMTVMGSYSVRADLNYEYYEGTWGDYLPDFDLLTPVKTGTVTDFNINDRDRDEYIGFRFTGYIEVVTDGSYTFYTTSDDGSALYIGNSQVVNNDGAHGMTERSGSINLTPGKHAITVIFSQGVGDFGLEVRYEGPGIAKALIPGGVLSLASHTASFPLPAHEATGADPAAVLEWQAPGLVTGPEYYVYFDPNSIFPSGPVAGIPQTETEYDPYDTADMAAGTKYYWRIDVYDPNNGHPVTHTGNLWSFTTQVGLVMYYKDDPNDLSGNEYHGSLQGDAEFVVDALRGKVLSLDGTDDFMNLVEPKTAAELGIGGNTSKSMTAWVYTRSFNDGGLFDVGAHSDGQEFCLRTLTADNAWRIQYQGSYDIDFVCDSLNKWVHFALVHDGTDTRMYVNGILKAEAPRVLNTSGSDIFRVGQYGSNEFDGLIDEFTLWDRALSVEDIRTIMPAGDFNANGGVDAADLKTLADGWLADNTTPILPTEPLDSMEYCPPGGTWIIPSIFSWYEYFNTDCPDSHGIPSTILGEPNNIPEGDQAVRIVFDYPLSCGYVGGGDWLMVGSYIKVQDGAFPPTTVHVDMAQYDELRFWKRNHGEGHADIRWEIILGSDSPSGTTTDEHMVVRIGPFSSTEDPNEWREVVVDLRNGDNVSWQGYGSIDDVQYIHAILITAISNIGVGEAGEITLDVDDFRLLDYTPGCSGLPATDLNGDCVVNGIDFGIVAEQWMTTGWW